MKNNEYNTNNKTKEENNVNQHVEIKKGDVILVELDGLGSEQKGIRPCICVSNNTSNHYSPNITIIAITSQIKAKLPVHVQLTADKHGMKKDCVAMCETVRTISKQRIIEKLVTLNEETMAEINDKLAIQLGLYSLDYSIKSKNPVAV